MENIDGFLGNIRALSSEKDELTQQLGAENENLRASIDTITAERDAFVSENQAVVQLLMDQGVHMETTSKNMTLQPSIEKLVREREQHRTLLGELRTENAKHVAEKERLAQERERLVEENRSYTEKVARLETSLQNLQRSQGQEKRGKETGDKEKQALQAKVCSCV